MAELRLLPAASDVLDDLFQAFRSAVQLNPDLNEDDDHEEEDGEGGIGVGGDGDGDGFFYDEKTAVEHMTDEQRAELDKWSAMLESGNGEEE